MKLRNAIAVAASVAVLSGVVATDASAAQYPEPLNNVMNELRNFAGPQGPNLLLVPAVLSSIGVVNMAVVVILSIVAAATGVGIAASS